MLTAKALIIGVASTATVGGVSYLTWTAIKEEEREDLELNAFSKEWNNTKGDAEKMALLERELKELCKGNEDGCKSKEQIEKVIQDKRPKLKDFFADDKFTNTDRLKTGFEKSCKETAQQMTIKVYCPS